MGTPLPESTPHIRGSRNAVKAIKKVISKNQPSRKIDFYHYNQQLNYYSFSNKLKKHAAKTAIFWQYSAIFRVFSRHFRSKSRTFRPLHQIPPPTRLIKQRHRANPGSSAWIERGKCVNLLISVGMRAPLPHT
jgi:hypothetical protein